MQTLVDIPDTQIEALHTLSKARNQTPAEFIAEVLSEVLAENRRETAEYFYWKDMDGDEYQRKIRGEWHR